MYLHCALCSNPVNLIKLKKELNFDLLTPPHGSGEWAAGIIVATNLLHLWYPLIWYATWPCSEKVEFWPKGRGGGGVCGEIFATMLLHSWFPLIWYATWPCSEKVEFWPIDLTPWVGSGGCRQNVRYHVAAFPVLYNLICKMTMLWKKLNFDLLDIDIDIEILFCVEYCTTCNISPVGLLLRQTRINKHF